jgi:hypothetical protein
MSLQTQEATYLIDTEPLTQPVGSSELERQHEITQAIGEIEALMHNTYAARRWGVTDQLSGGTHDLDMFAMRLPDGSGIEELVARSETRTIHRKTIDRVYAVEIFSDGQPSQQLRLDDTGYLKVLERQAATARGESAMVELDDDDALTALYEFRYRMNIARDRVERRTGDERAAADADALAKLRRQVYGAELTTTSTE